MAVLMKTFKYKYIILSISCFRQNIVYNMFIILRISLPINAILCINGAQCYLLIHLCVIEWLNQVEHIYFSSIYYFFMMKTFKILLTF